MDYVEQRSDEWFISRLGKFTGSEVGKLMSSERGKDKLTSFSLTAMSYIYQVASERDLIDCYKHSGEEFDIYKEQIDITSKPMEFGIEQEPRAREAYENKTGIHMDEVSSCVCKSMPYFAASPDGLGKDKDGNVGVLEIKTLGMGKYFKYRSEVFDNESLKKMNPQYYWQCIAEMICTNASWCDFTCFNPFVNHFMHITRIEPLEEDVTALLDRIRIANNMVDEILNK